MSHCRVSFPIIIQLIGLIQAFIIVVLAMVYIASATKGAEVDTDKEAKGVP